ncbi:MAG: hypothetical protein ABFR53_08365 [Actinomycetota bacterium]
MTAPGRAELIRADGEPDRSLRRLWLVAAIDAIVVRTVFLVGGAAVDLHTGGYVPTDVDIVGVVTPDDRRALVDAGFVETGGRHLRWDYPDGTKELVEFPESTLDGSFERIRLADEVLVNVITAESLVVDRIVQATDGSDVTFVDALRLIIATADRVDWVGVAADLKARPETPYLGSMDKARELLTTAGLPEVAVTHFESA